MEFTGKPTKSAICWNCETVITYTVWYGLPDGWSHDINGRPECPGGPVAEPIEDSIHAYGEAD